MPAPRTDNEEKCPSNASGEGDGNCWNRGHEVPPQPGFQNSSSGIIKEVDMKMNRIYSVFTIFFGVSFLTV